MIGFKLKKKADDVIEVKSSISLLKFSRVGLIFFFLVIFGSGLVFSKECFGWGKKEKTKKISPEKLAKKAATISQKHFSKALKLREKGKNDLAIEELKKAIEVDPSFADAYLEIGDLYFQLDLPEKVAEYLEPGLKMALFQGLDSRKIGKGFYQLAKGHQITGKIASASEEISQAITLLPEDPLPKKILGDIHVQNGNFDAGMAAYRESLKLDQGNAECWQALARAALKNKKLAELQNAFIALQRLDPLKAAEFEEVMKNSKIKPLKREIKGTETPDDPYAIDIPSKKTGSN